MAREALWKKGRGGKKTEGNGAKPDAEGRGDGEGDKKKERVEGGNASFCVTHSLKLPDSKCWEGDNRMISPIRKRSEGLWVGSAVYSLFFFFCPPTFY